jgi:putative Holliday junction resolvase
VSVPACVLGIDYGTVRIGLAVSDPDRKFAFPLTTYTRRNPQLDETFFRQVAAEQSIGEIVVGLPIHLSGHEGQKAGEARTFGQWLAGLLGCTAAYWDERFTTVEAENHLLAAGLTNKRRKARRDRVAAQIMLQSYLDAGCPGTQPIGPLDG